MVELRTRYLGLDLRTPLVASASPLTGSLDGLPSLFEEQLTQEADQVGRLLQRGAGGLSAALALDDYNAGPFGYLALVEKAKATLQIPVIASLNGVTPGAWVEHASLLEEAGADALELNSYYVSSSPGLGGSEVEWRYLELVRSVRQRIGVPLAVKLSPYFSSVANLARQLVEAGADGLVLFNRFYQPDLDLRPWRSRPTWCCRPLRSCGCRCAGSPSFIGRSRPRWPPRPGSTPPPTRSRCCWPGRMWP
jgi:dihydroorotate dehydrogenase (fumarate)